MKLKEVIFLIFGVIVLAILVSFSVIHNAVRPVENVAVKFSSENANYFYTLFKKKYGMTPLNYRKQMKVDV